MRVAALAAIAVALDMEDMEEVADHRLNQLLARRLASRREIGAALREYAAACSRGEGDTWYDYVEATLCAYEQEARIPLQDAPNAIRPNACESINAKNEFAPGRRRPVARKH
jgi:hypothetical protein